MSDRFNLFAELEEYGIKEEKINNIFADDDKKSEKKEEKKEPVIDENDFIFDKNYTCPVCTKMFKSKQVKIGKARFVGTESDLRPIYQGVDTVKYDVIVCLHCGYAALSKNFAGLSVKQERDIREHVSKTFKGMTNAIGPYTYQNAIVRYKLALLSSVIKHSRLSERAYICLKIAWLYRGSRERIEKEYAGRMNDKIKYLVEKHIETEEKFISYAYEGFSKALPKEPSPICGMDDNTINYLMGELARRNKDYDNAEKYCFKVIEAKGPNANLKEKARNLRDNIKKDREAQPQQDDSPTEE